MNLTHVHLFLLFNFYPLALFVFERKFVSPSGLL